MISIGEQQIGKILENFAEPLFKAAEGYLTDEWNKFKLNSEIAFTKYLENATEKYSKIKTVLYRTEPKPLYDFFEYPMLQKGSEKICSEDIDTILELSHHIVIRGTGGLGKSTLMKHLFLSENKRGDLIPIFIELKNLNTLPDDADFKKFVFSQMCNLGVDFDFKYLDYALKSGCFLFLLDGYDEIITQKKDMFFSRIVSFCDKYAENYFILSSRPYSEFVEFQRFTVLNLCEFTKKQALSMVNNLDYDVEIKQHFIQELDKSLYEKHKSFASNPLLLTIMLMTYDNFAEIPEKLHVFYANAFETLYTKHDATKGGYRRELKTKLDFESFRKVFACFCFITYAKGKTELSYEDMREAFLKVQHITNTSFSIEAVIDDLSHAVCAIYRDGLTYHFTHRSFQEYFTALFLKELPDENMKKISLKLVEADEKRVSQDNVFSMLFDMCTERVEQNIILPILEEVEKDYTTTDKYDFYYEKFPFSFKLVDDYPDREKEILLVKTSNEKTKVAKWDRFLRGFVHREIRTQERLNQKYQARDDRALIEYLKTNYTLDEMRFQSVTSMDYHKGDAVYEMIKKSWLGRYIYILSILREELAQRKERADIDLEDLLF